MTTLVVLSVLLIAVFIAGLAGYLFVVGGQLSRIATLLEECAEIVWKINRDAQVIEPGVERINNTGGVIAGALPLLYGMAEDIVVGATYEPDPDPEPEPARPAMGSRRSRLHESVGYSPEPL
ncbi:MAG: hypothetical protein OXH78_01205 [Acidimicrobiaceae bacterium]|nr:hypothetical protein [Acidimicrobiaceae bacterium]